MNIANVKYNCIENGIGVRTTIFVSGCKKRCKGCQNEEAWDFNYGEHFSRELKNEILEKTAPSWIAGITLCGGEPFEEENEPELVEFCNEFRAKMPEKNIWAYTGYWYEQLYDRESKLLRCVDVLIDGPFIWTRHSVMTPFRGSTNQRVLELKDGVLVREILYD